MERAVVQRLLRLPAVLEVTGLQKSQLFLAVESAIFPRPVRILETGRAIAWVESEVADWIASRVAARDAAAADKKPQPRRPVGRPRKHPVSAEVTASSPTE